MFVNEMLYRLFSISDYSLLFMEVYKVKRKINVNFVRLLLYIVFHATHVSTRRLLCAESFRDKEE